jgi:hypothetical protein
MFSNKYHIEEPSACLPTWLRVNADDTYYPNLLFNVKHAVKKGTTVLAPFDGFTDCFGMEET